MKKIILVLAALILSANSSMAQTATPATNAVVADKKADVIMTPEIIEINKKIYQAKVANKPIDDLLKKKKEIILRIKAEREAAGATTDKK